MMFRFEDLLLLSLTLANDDFTPKDFCPHRRHRVIVRCPRVEEVETGAAEGNKARWQSGVHSGGMRGKNRTIKSFSQDLFGQNLRA
jgi:hypothetical protein